MSSRHAQKWRGFRPDPGEYDAAEDLLDARGKAMSEYLRACLRWLEQAPDEALATVGPHWPPPRPRGRPRSPRRDVDDHGDARSSGHAAGTGEASS
ncbi:hypothetical protein [Prauserella muralis]|uniref:Uncharacterized protein n=1 Tax=Prauserella muralis TaxID=588067 RepID=A0A2V4AC31_9PSEU|nr:hypothetical protein [Prauserella muralis]PXY16543.1 hypothetical protein BAY60_35675 [Prauserella muralis]TWE11217.1 hypothetical protein FHX69_7438 [Prauserella muralis]